MLDVELFSETRGCIEVFIVNFIKHKKYRKIAIHTNNKIDYI